MHSTKKPHNYKTLTYNDCAGTVTLKKHYHTVLSGSSDPFYVVTYIKWATTSWTTGKLRNR